VRVWDWIKREWSRLRKVLGRRRVAILTVCVLASVPIAFALAWKVGRWAAVAPATFDWNAAAAAGTAAGTLALALVTGMLAVLTSEEVRLTRSIRNEPAR
jgi:hypothetical protein